MKSIKTPFILTLIAAIAVTAAVVGCNKKTTESELNDATSKTVDTTKDAATATKDAVTNAVDKMK